MRRIAGILTLAIFAMTFGGCAMWDGLVEFERRKNEWLFGPRTAHLEPPVPVQTASPVDQTLNR